jgi:Poly (ADP-ribose) glycohydrolase (PARG)
MEILLRRSFDAADLPPAVLEHSHKRLAYELATSGPAPAGTIEVTRWRAGAVPTQMFETDVVIEPGYYTYGDDANVWHINFADPSLFAYYGTALLAQDELQCLEHPALGPLHEALGGHACTFVAHANWPTPVLVKHVERRCALVGLYGNAFAAASADEVRAALSLVRPPTHTNIIAIAAPVGSGAYRRRELDQIVETAYCGFAAAMNEGAIEVRTGFWGCGAFGGNRIVMTSLQLYAAQLAGVARVRFYAFDASGRADAHECAALASLAGARIVDAILERELEWGVGNGT